MTNTNRLAKVTYVMNTDERHLSEVFIMVNIKNEADIDELKRDLKRQLIMLHG